MTAQVYLDRRAPDAALRAFGRLPDEFIRDSWFVGSKALLQGPAQALARRANAARLAWESGLEVIDARLKSESRGSALRRARGELLAALGRVEEAVPEVAAGIPPPSAPWPSG